MINENVYNFVLELIIKYIDITIKILLVILFSVFLNTLICHNFFILLVSLVIFN